MKTLWGKSNASTMKTSHAQKLKARDEKKKSFTVRAQTHSFATENTAVLTQQTRSLTPVLFFFFLLPNRHQQGRTSLCGLFDSALTGPK